MRPSRHFQQLAHCCNHLASDISEDNGFVSVRKLLERFGAKLFVRPLLVEGMLASSENEVLKRNSNDHQWSLIIDSETHNVSDEDIIKEKFGSPLSPRFRNTVAHELAHSLAFRPTEFGVEFPKQFKSEKTKREFVAQIEKETEKLSPLLLIPDRLLDRVFTLTKERITIDELCDIKFSLGVSRSLIVNRLNLLSISDEKRLKAHRQSLRNLAVGIGKWKTQDEAVLKSFPFYSAFSGGKLPAFILQLQKGLDISAKAFFNNSEFVLCGGDVNKIEISVPAGTFNCPNSVQLPILCAVENTSQKAGSEFLFIVQALE